MGLTKARLRNLSKDEEPLKVLYNPSQYEIDSNLTYASLPVPGLSMPLLQFTGGGGSTLTVDLFLDQGSERGPLLGTEDRADIEGALDRLRGYARIDPDLHSPPVVRLEWGNRMEAGQPAAFEGVITNLKETMVLFTPAGNVARAKVHLVIKSYQTVAVQQRTLRPSSPDRTRVRVVREGETLAQLAYEAYGDPGLWRLIAEENGLTRVRFLEPGTALRIRAVV